MPVFRVPLHIKLVISYLLVVALALVPTAVYLRTSLHREQTDRARAQLRHDLVPICERLAQGAPGDLRGRAGYYRFAAPTRVTVMAANGDVLMDSEQPEAHLPNHADRPEVRDALQSGVGWAERRSATTGQRMLYVAMRFPPTGPALGVARLSERIDGLEAGREKIEAVLRNAGAVALTVAVLLGLVAALVTVRPLRTIASAARAIADGDFGTTLHLRTGDEIEDVATAIDAIVARLRDRLVATGAEQATTQAIFDELPVGIVIFDEARQPVRLNPAARALCGLDPNVEAARGAELPTLPGQRAAIDRACEEARGVTLPLSLPWRPEAALTARWVRVFDEDGGDVVALIVIDRSHVAEIAAARSALAEAAPALRRAAAESRDRGHAESLLALAERCVAVTPHETLGDRAVSRVSLQSLVVTAREGLGPILAGREVRLSGVGVDDLAVADVDGRCEDALRTMIHWLASGTGDIDLRVVVEGGVARVSGRGPAVETPGLTRLSAALRPLGGDGGVVRGDDHDERWIRLPRA